MESKCDESLDGKWTDRSASGELRPQTLYRGSDPGPQTSYCRPLTF